MSSLNFPEKKKKKKKENKKDQNVICSSCDINPQYVEQEDQDGPVSLTRVPDKFQVNGLFGSGEVQYRLSRWQL